jgi:ferric-dicitrate binding protein FerR (iron transport regulator)
MENSMNNLIVKYLQGECNKEEINIVEDWKNATEQNLKEFNIVKKVLESSNYLNPYYSALDIEKELERNLQRIYDREKLSIADYGKRPGLKVFMRYAAIALLFLGLGAYLSWQTLYQRFNVYQVTQSNYEVMAPMGSQSVATLPDGTKVWLNAGTKLTYSGNYGINDRNVKLEGEAYFNVKTNPEKPFVVSTSELKIKAFGTSFNVKAYPDEKDITTTLEEGKVTITGNGVDIVMQPRQKLKYERRKLNPGHTGSPKKEIEIQPETNLKETEVLPNVTTYNDVNVEMYTAWKDNRWIIESENLSEIKILLERKFNVEVELKSDELLKYTFRGIFTNETLEQILDVFRYTAPISYKIEKGVVSIEIDKSRKSKYLEITTK